MSELTGRVIRGYELRERIGGGGFGEVYNAYQALLKREVAVKIILPQFANDPDFIRRFEVEAETIARLEHPFIVPLFDYWREPDGAYLVMRLLKGGSLKEQLEEVGAFDLQRVAKYVDEIAAGLYAAHLGQVVHRDIKPANILLDEYDNAYLVDFGIAYDLSVPSKGDTTAIYTPQYASPEQLREQTLSPQSDLYSLGLVIFEMLTGQPAFSGNLVDVVQAHFDSEIPSASGLRTDIPIEVDDVLAKATRKEPSERYTTALELAEAFRDALRFAGGIDSEQTQPIVRNAALEIRDALTTQANAENPYKGLRAFQEGDASDFFGRNELTERLVKRLDLNHNGARFLAVVGPSGSGKSSVVRAGLIPSLRQGGLTGSDQWFISDMFPGNTPISELENALLKVAVSPPDDLREQLERDTNGLHRVLQKILPGENGQLVLVIDQFEELFTQVEDEAVRTHFIDSIINAITAPHPALRVIVTIRADFYDRPLQYERLGEWMRQQTEVVLPLSAAELERAIVGPAERVGIMLEPLLTQSIIDEVLGQPGTLPLLQYTLTELFDRRSGRSLTLTSYHEIGGVTGSLARRANELYADLDAEGQYAVRQLFLRLVTLGEGTEDTRRRVRRSEVATSDRVDEVIDIFGKGRLLTFDKDQISREPTIEVAHEALIRTWDQLRQWIDDSREDLRIQRRLSNATNEWLNAKKDASFLATGARLTQFEEWRGTTALELNEIEEEYIETSLRVEAEKQAEQAAIARRVQNFQRASLILGVMVIVAIAATGIFLQQANQARNSVAQSNQTLTPAQETVVAAETLAQDANAQVITAQAQVDSVGITLTPAQATVIAAQEQVAQVGATLTPVQGTVVAAQAEADNANNLAATAQALAGNSQTQAAVVQELTVIAPTVQSAGNAVAALQLQIDSVGATLTPAQATVIAAQDLVDSVGATLTPVQGTVVAAQAEADNANNLAATAQAQVDSVGATLTPVQSTVVAAQVEADNANNLAATAQAQVDSVGETLTPVQGTVVAAQIEADNANNLAATAQAQVDSVGATLTPVQGTVVAAQVEADNANNLAATAQALAGNSQTQAAVVQELTLIAPTLQAAGEVVANLQSQVDNVGATLTPAQATISAAQEQVAMVGATLTPIQGTIEAAFAARAAVQDEADAISLAVNAEQAINNNNYDLALALTIESLRLNPNLTRAKSIINQIAFGTARLSYENSDVWALSPDGRYFAIADGREIAIIDVPTRREIDRLTGHTAQVLSLDFNTSGTQLASGSADTTAILWNTSAWASGGNASEQVTLTGHTAAVRVVKYSPRTDTPSVFTGSDDTNIIAWTSGNGSELSRYTGNSWPVTSIEFVGSDGGNFFTQVDANGTPILLYWTITSVNPRSTNQNIIYDVYNDDATRGMLGGNANTPLTVYNATQFSVVRQFISNDFRWGADIATAYDFRPGGREILVGIENSDGNDRLLLVDIASSAIVRRFDGDGTDRVDAISFSQDGSLVLTADNNRLILWDVEQGTPLRVLASHEDVITDIWWSADSTYAVSRSRDGNIRLWDIAGGDEALRQIIPIRTEIATGNYPGFNSNGSRVFSGVWVSMFGWNSATGEFLGSVSTGDEIRGVVYSPTQSQALAVLEFTSVLYSLDNSPPTTIRNLGPEGANFSGIAAYSPDGNFVALDDRNSIFVYDLTRGNRVSTISKPRFDDGQAVTSLAITSDRQRVIATFGIPDEPDADAGEIIVWDTTETTGVEVTRFPTEHTRTMNFITVSDDGQRVLTASSDNTLILWSIDGQPLRQFVGHDDDVTVGRLLPDNTSVLSASRDRTVILWDIDTGQLLRTFRGSPNAITDMNISVDGRQFVTTMGNDLMLVWEITDIDDLIAWTLENRFIRQLTQAECDQFNVRNCSPTTSLTIPDSASASAVRTPIVVPTAAENTARQPVATPEPDAPSVDEDAPVVVNRGGSGINVRNSDSTSAGIVTALQSGEVATITGRSNRDTRWFRIALEDGLVGWVRNDVVSVEGDVSNVPDVTPPVVITQPTTAPVATSSGGGAAPPASAGDANLIVTGIGFQPNPPQCGQPFTVLVNIINTGTTPTSGGGTLQVIDRYTANGAQQAVGSNTFPVINPGQNFVVPVPLTVSTYLAEQHTMIAIVDVTNAVPETNDGDNQFSINYVLGAGSC